MELKTDELSRMKRCMELEANANSSMIETLTKAHSDMFGIDTEKESEKQAKLQILSETATALLAQARQLQANRVLVLLNLA